MNVFKLELDCSRCDGVGMALVAAPDFESAIEEYVKSGECSDDVASGLMVFTKQSEEPIYGLHYDGSEEVLCDCFCFNQDI